MSAEFLLFLFVVVGSVTSYAAGYFRERKVVEPPEKDPELPADADGSLRALFEAYSEEVRVKYLRNHSRRRADKFFREFVLVSFHFAVFVGLALACATIDVFAQGLTAMEILVGLTYLTMGLKAGQLTASKETVDHKEKLLVHMVEVVNMARKNMLNHAQRESWVAAMQIRDEKTPLHY